MIWKMDDCNHACSYRIKDWIVNTLGFQETSRIKLISAESCNIMLFLFPIQSYLDSIQKQESKREAEEDGIIFW